MKYYINLLIISLLWSCNPPKENKILQEAAKIHNQAIKIHTEIMPQMDELKTLSEKFKNQKDSLSNAQKSTKMLDSLINHIQQIELAMQDWMKNIVEVPSNEAHQHSEGAHHHDHSAKVEVSEEEMLAIQKEMLKNIQNIQKTTTELLANSKETIRN
jgi:hypothetical protein